MVVSGAVRYPFHLVLPSAALVMQAKSIPAYSLILSFHFFFGPPILLFPFTVPCGIVIAKPEDLDWAKSSQFQFPNNGREFVIVSNGYFGLSAEQPYK